MKLKKTSLVSLVLALGLVFSTTSLAAQPTAEEEELRESAASGKYETVYALLQNDGSVQKVSVVNRLEAEEPGIYTDYGRYSEIINLTDETQPTISEDEIRWTLEEGAPGGFYYQGTLENAELPYLFSIRYRLNGEKISAEELAGRSGTVEIIISVTANGAAQDFFQTQYAVQILVPVSLANTSVLSCEGASQAVTGQSAQLAYTVLPGASQEFTLKLESTGFTMDSITISLAQTDVGAMIDSDQITAGFEQLENGVGAIVEGTQALQNGMAQLGSGVSQLADGAKELQQGALQFDDGMDEYAAGLSKLGQNMGSLVSGSGQIRDGLSKLKGSGGSLLEGYEQIGTSLSDVQAQLKQYEEMLEQLEPTLPPETAQLLPLIKQLLAGLSNGMGEMADGMAQLNEGLTAYAGGVDALAGQYGQFHSGIAQLPDAADQLADGFDALQEGSGQLVDGIAELADGLGQVSSQISGLPNQIGELVSGQQQLKDGVTEAKDQIVGLMGADGEETVPTSFAAPGKCEPELLTFVMRTPGISAPEEEQSVSVQPEEDKSLWQKFLDLFS